MLKRTASTPISLFLQKVQSVDDFHQRQSTVMISAPADNLTYYRDREVVESLTNAVTADHRNILLVETMHHAIPLAAAQESTQLVTVQVPQAYICDSAILSLLSMFIDIQQAQIYYHRLLELNMVSQALSDIIALNVGEAFQLSLIDEIKEQFYLTCGINDIMNVLILVPIDLNKNQLKSSILADISRCINENHLLADISRLQFEQRFYRLVGITQQKQVSGRSDCFIYLSLGDFDVSGFSKSFQAQLHFSMLKNMKQETDNKNALIELLLHNFVQPMQNEAAVAYYKRGFQKVVVESCCFNIYEWLYNGIAKKRQTLYFVSISVELHHLIVDCPHLGFSLFFHTCREAQQRLINEQQTACSLSKKGKEFLINSFSLFLNNLTEGQSMDGYIQFLAFNRATIDQKAQQTWTHARSIVYQMVAHTVYISSFEKRAGAENVAYFVNHQTDAIGNDTIHMEALIECIVYRCFAYRYMLAFNQDQLKWLASIGISRFMDVVELFVTLMYNMIAKRCTIHFAIEAADQETDSVQPECLSWK